MANAWEDVNKIGVGMHLPKMIVLSVHSRFSAVLYDFTASGQFQISLTAGERVEVKKASSGPFVCEIVRVAY